MDSVTDRNRSDGGYQETYECSFPIWSEGCISNFQTDDERKKFVGYKDLRDDSKTLENEKNARTTSVRLQVLPARIFRKGSFVCGLLSYSCDHLFHEGYHFSPIRSFAVIDTLIFDIWFWMFYNSWQREKSFAQQIQMYRKRQQRHVYWKNRSRIFERSSKDNFVIMKSTMPSWRRQSKDDSNVPRWWMMDPYDTSTD